MNTSSSRSLRLVARGLLALTILSCGGGGDGDGGGGPSGSFSVAAPTTLSIEAGSSGSVQVTVTRSGDFSSAVTLTLEDFPEGVSHNFTPVLVPNGTNSATLLVSVAGTVAPGTYTIKVCGNASGFSERDALIALTVTAPPTGGFTLTLDPAALSVEQYQNKTTTVTISRAAPFTGAVALEILIAPAGVTRTFAPAEIPAGSTSATLTIAVGPEASPAVYPLVVRGSAPGVTIREATLLLTVTAYPGNFSLAVNPGALSVEQGKSGTAGVTIVRTAPFAGPVGLSVAPAVEGITAAFTPSVIPANATTSTLSLSVSPVLTPGVYALDVHATGAGVPEWTAPLILTVTEAPGFTLQAAGVAVQQGQVGGAGVNVLRKGGFTGAVTLSLDGTLPAGVTTDAPVTVPAGVTASAINFSVQATAPVGSHPLTLRGAAPGVSDYTKQIILEIRAAPSGNVTFTFCSASEMPIWFGYKDYQSAYSQWTQVAPVGGVFNFPVTAARGGVAWVTSWTDEPGYYIGMFLGTQAELVELGSTWCSHTPARKSHTGSVANVGSDWFNVSIGDATEEVHGNMGPNYELHDVPLGTFDLFASKTTIPVGETSSTVIIRRGINYPAGTVIPLLDFNSLEAIVTTKLNAWVDNYGAEFVKFTEAYVTAGGTVGLFAHRDPKLFPTALMVIPPGSTQAGDFYNLKAESSELQDGAVSRMVVKSFSAPTDQTLTLGPPLTAPSVFQLQAAPLYQVQVLSSWQAEYGNLFTGRYMQNTRDGEFYVTRGFLGAGSAIDVTTPDLRTVPGWNQTWGPVPGVTTVLKGMAYGWTGTTGALFPGFLGDFLTTPNITVRTAALFTSTVP